MVARSRPGRLRNSQGMTASHHNGESRDPSMITAIAVLQRQAFRFRRRGEIGCIQGMRLPRARVYSLQFCKIYEKGMLKCDISIAVKSSGGTPVARFHVGLEKNVIVSG
jgi:hypothetical protein